MKNKVTIQATKKERIDPDILDERYEVVEYDSEGNPIYQVKAKYQSKGIWWHIKRGLLP